MSHQKLTLSEEEKKWLTDDFWPTPNWLNNDTQALSLESYQDYFMYRLRVLYIDLESDFRLTFHRKHQDEGFLNHAMHFAHRIVKVLQICRQGLEDQHKSKSINHLLNISNNLSLIDSYRIWMYNQAVVARKYQDLRKHTENTLPEVAAMFEKVAPTDSQGNIRAGELRDAYVELVNASKWHRIQREITFGLQVERLQLLIRGGLLAILLTVLLSPLFIANLKGVMPPLLSTLKTPAYVNSWLIMIGFAVIGGLGGFLSGLMQVKSNKVGLEEYKESKLKFQLKPVVGGITATILFVFLSWQVIPGVVVQSFGAYLLIAFLSGFSERYFLNLLKIDEQKGEAIVAKMKTKVAPVAKPEPVKVSVDKPTPTMTDTKVDPPHPDIYQVSSSGGSKSAYDLDKEE